MSPTLVFPSPFRHRDLPPYGPSDWRRLQPVLLRRSLALSSGTALVAGLLLAVLLHQAAELVPDHGNIIILPPVPPPIPEPDPRPSGNLRTPIAKGGAVVMKEHDDPMVQDSLVAPTPGIFDPSAPLPPGTIGIPGNATVAHSDYPERPDPGKFVALDEFPKEVYSPKPEYPELARQANMEGTVILNVLVDREGKVQEIILARSSPMFDEAAEQAIRQWRFRPAIMGHEAVAAWVHIPVRFVIHGE